MTPLRAEMLKQMQLHRLAPKTQQAYVDAVGLTQLNCTFAMGKMPPEVVERSIRLFADEVMPHFR